MRGWNTHLLQLLLAVTLVIVAVILGRYVEAREIVVSGNLQQAIDEASTGDVLILSEKEYSGPLLISKSISLRGRNFPHIIGTGQGTVITVSASYVVLSGLYISGSGLLLETQDSGIFLTKTSENVIVEGNKLENNLIGIYVSGSKNSFVQNNEIIGRQDLRMNERGNGIQIWNAPGTVIERNTISYGRDGIFVTTSKKNIFKNNVMQNLRFAIHYMYTNKSQVIGNYSRNNHMGYALMSSTNLIVDGNVSDGDKNRGLLFNYANKVKVTRNVVKGGAEKCVFIYNSNKNHFEQNSFSDCEIGIHFTAGSERNAMTRNAFVGNKTQVKYVGTRWLEWSVNGVGNYWSDHGAFDLDRNGLADSVYRPNDLTDRVMWQYPSAKLLLNSPAVQVLKYAQSAFPAVHPGGVVDSAPLMKNPTDGISRLVK
jgi:nitrous oxidase accessory protein